MGYRIRLLGTFHCLYDGSPLKSSLTNRQQLLFAYLLLHSDIPVSKKHLAFQFWPDTTEAQALTNLRKLVYDLKKNLPASDVHLELSGGQLVWHSRGRCSVDVWDFERKVDSRTQDDLEFAAACYRGDLRWIWLSGITGTDWANG